MAHVNAIARMLEEYLRIPHKLVLLTDQNAEGAEVEEILPVPRDPKGLRLVKTVNCYRRLRFFDPEYIKHFDTEWLMSIDLDTLILADITDSIEKALDEEFGFVILKGRWADRAKNLRPYNGAFYMLKLGQHGHVWADFDPVETPKEIHRRRWVGSDQSWLGMALPGAPTLGPDDGFYFFGQYLKARKFAKSEKITPARVLNFAGFDKPWAKSTRFQAKDIWDQYMQWL